MSEILLLRHGKSDWSVETNDFNRPLTNRGKRSAQRMGAWLQSQDLIPQTIWSSPAKRAIETVEKTIKVMGLPVRDIQLLPELYEASSTTLLEVIDRARQNKGLTLIVGHNPSMEMALEALVETQLPQDGKVMPTAALAHLCFQQEQVELRQLIKAKTLPKTFSVMTSDGVMQRDRPAYYYQQSGVVPFIWKKGILQVLLVTKSHKSIWGVPKGIIEPGYSAMDSAAKEAKEEAGVLGDVVPEILGQYQHEKWGGTCHISLYPMKVTQLLDDDMWESDKRQRKWFTLAEAQQQIANPDIQAMMAKLALYAEEKP